VHPAKFAAYKATPQAEESKRFWLSRSVVGPPFALLVPKNLVAIWQCRYQKCSLKTKTQKIIPAICECDRASETESK